MIRLLSDDLPLRSTRDLGNYGDDKTLAERYGDLSQSRFGLVQLTSDRWAAANHPMEIFGVFIADVETSAWDLTLEANERGEVAQIVRLAAPAPPDAKVSAIGRGKLNPRTGALITNPADLFEDVLSRMAGRAVQFSGLRAECSARGLTIAESIEAPISVQGELNRIAKSIGAVWTRDFARLYPTTEVLGPIIELDENTTDGITVSTSAANAFDVLRIAYDIETATGRHLKSMELSARPKRYGGLVRTMELPLLRTARDAQDVGTRYLARGAGERYDVDFASSDRRVREGQYVRFKAMPGWWVGDSDPVVFVKSRSVAPGSKGGRFSGEYIAAYPQIRVTAFSVALPSSRGAALEVAFIDGVLTLTVLDSDQRPIKDARVTLDEGLPKTTSATGAVTFTAAKGRHVVLIEAPGFVPQPIEITI